MLKAREYLRLVSIGTRHLDGDEPAAQADFLGEINPRECASAQLEDDAKSRQKVTGPRQLPRCGARCAAGGRARPGRAAGAGAESFAWRSDGTRPERPRRLELKAVEQLAALCHGIGRGRQRPRSDRISAVDRRPLKMRPERRRPNPPENARIRAGATAFRLWRSVAQRQHR